MQDQVRFLESRMDDKQRIDEALDLAWKSSKLTDPAHKQWIIDQMFRVLAGDPNTYKMMIGYYNQVNGEWDVGIAP